MYYPEMGTPAVKVTSSWLRNIEKTVLPHSYGSALQLSGAAQEIGPLLPQSEGKVAPGKVMWHTDSFCVIGGRYEEVGW